jgi:endonuclease YncB( thermonuclease family)
MMKRGARAAVIAILVTLALCSLARLQYARAFSQDVYEITARVMHVIDGDTIVLDNGEHVRYQGINAPEIRHEDMDAEPSGYDALRRNRELVQGKTVRLVINRRDERDRYGRLIAQAFLPDGRAVQRLLVSEGLATVCSYERGVYPEQGLLNLQTRAIDTRRGMWSASAARPERYYIGNSNSRRFHRPSCPFGRQTSRANAIIFHSREEAFKSGYCPCRKCLP